ncbi:MAG: hypothetical protein JRJ86_18540 [Deltaproteobacteria bacterium]|nr:hypothetical protein [Deltaproteobacteria bacterium]
MSFTFSKNGQQIPFMTFIILIGIAFSSIIYAEAQRYQPVDQSELYFVFRAKLKSVSVDADGNIQNIDGKVDQFRLLHGDPIELETQDIVLEGKDAFIHTKNYGKVKITMNSNMQTTIWLTPEQKKEFLELKKTLSNK